MNSTLSISRRGRGVIATVALTAAGLGYGVATEAPAQASAPTAVVAASSAVPSEQTARAQLVEIMDGMDQVAVVRVDRMAQDGSTTPGYTGAALISGNRVQVMEYVQRDGHWTWAHGRVLAHPAPITGDKADLTVSATLPTGSQTALIVVHGPFNAEIEDQAVAYAWNSDAGWGALVAQSDGTLRSSGTGISDPDGLGVELDFWTYEPTTGFLSTSSLWGNSSSATLQEQLADPIYRSWVGEDGGYRMLGSSGGPSD